MRRIRRPSLRRLSPGGGVQDPAQNIDCTEFEVDTWTISEFVVSRLVPIVGWHPFPLHELMLLVATVCRFKPTEIYEWGTHIGKSARMFYESASHFDIETEIHTIDLDDDQEHPEHPRSERGRLVLGMPVHLHQGDGVTISLGLWRRSGREPRPLFFLDGDHAYQSVLRELRGIMDEVPNAVILVHDAFYQSPEAGYNVGPHDAIRESLSLHSRYRLMLPSLGLPGLALLYPKEDGDGAPTPAAR